MRKKEKLKKKYIKKKTTKKKVGKYIKKKTTKKKVGKYIKKISKVDKVVCDEVIDNSEGITKENNNKLKPLMPQQQSFCNYFVESFNATKSAKLAGYSEKSASAQGCVLLKLPKVKAEIQRLKKIKLDELGVTKESVLKRLYDIGFSNIGDYVDWENDREMEEIGVKKGVISLRPGDSLSDHQKSLINEITQTKEGWKLKLKDALRALELLGRHFGMFDEKTVHGGEVKHKFDLSNLSDKEVEERFLKLKKKLMGQKDGI